MTQGSTIFMESNICRDASIISHVLFTNGCILFFGANSHEIKSMQNIFETYNKRSNIKSMKISTVLILPNKIQNLLVVFSVFKHSLIQEST